MIFIDKTKLTLFILSTLLIANSTILPNASLISNIDMVDKISTKVSTNGVKMLKFTDLEIIDIIPLLGNTTTLAKTVDSSYTIDQNNQVSFNAPLSIDIKSSGLPNVFILNSDMSVWKYKFDPKYKSFNYIEKSESSLSSSSPNVNATISFCLNFLSNSTNVTSLHGLLINSPNELGFLLQDNLSGRVNLKRGTPDILISKITCENQTAFAFTNSSTLEVYKISSTSIALVKSWNVKDIGINGITDIAFDGINSVLFIATGNNSVVKAFKYSEISLNLTEIASLEINSTSIWRIFWDSETLYIFEKYTSSVNLLEYAIDTAKSVKLLNRAFSVYFIPLDIDIEPNFIVMKGLSQVMIFRRYVNYYLTKNSDLLLNSVVGDFGNTLQVIETGSYTAEVLSINGNKTISLKTLNFVPKQIKIGGDKNKSSYGTFVFPFQMVAANCIAINNTYNFFDYNITEPSQNPNPRAWTGCTKNYTLSIEFYDETTSDEGKAWIAGLVLGIILVFVVTLIIICSYYKSSKRKQEGLQREVDIYSSNEFMELKGDHLDVLSPTNNHSNQLVGNTSYDPPKSRTIATAKFHENSPEIDENVINFEIQ